MQFLNDSLTLSATDLSNFLACPHLSLLDRHTALGGPKPRQFDDPALEVLRQRGLEHERKYLETLGPGVVEIADSPDAFARTRSALRKGARVIYHGALRNERTGWLGKPDFLIRVEQPSRLGGWSYEVVDAKLAREAKGGALLQLLVYADLLEAVQGVPPAHVHLALGGPEARTISFRTADYAAYFRALRRRFEDRLANAPGVLPTAPDPVAHCDVCAWHYQCDAELREADHLSLVAGITKRQRRALVEVGVDTLEKLAVLDLAKPKSVSRVHPAALLRVREQARIQSDGRRKGSPIHELLEPIVSGEGLAALPPPSPGDLFFDLEGDPYALTHGLEYLFGHADVRGAYTVRWAMDRAAEKRAFEEFIDFVTARQEKYPDLHVYHFAPYEPTALKRLMGFHATREEQVDRLLRGKIFVDLHRVVRQALRASVESYSIKKLEPLYGFDRSIDLRSASSALAHFEAWLELGGDGGEKDDLLDRIEGYNRDDCLSTLRLREWLESLRAELSGRTGHEVPRPAQGDPEPPPALAEREVEIAALIEALMADMPAEPTARSQEQQARWLLAQLLGFHRREVKSAWWEYFRFLELSDEELVEDSATLGGLTYEGVVGRGPRSNVHRYRFPHQDHGLRAGKEARDPKTEKKAGAIVAIDNVAGTIDLQRGNNSKAPHPTALIPYDIIGDAELRESIRRVTEVVLAAGLGEGATYRAAADLLMRRPPRVGQIPGDPIKASGEKSLDAALRLVGVLDRSVLPIQGPPGAGKTFTGARMILEALKSGKRVGITAASHKVICNLLEAVCDAAKEVGFTVRVVQKAEKADACVRPEIIATNDNGKAREALLEGEAQLGAGTAWFWSRDGMIGSVDLLFIDEAGQFSLASAVAVAPAAGSLVLLGDPRQLDQPLQGVHPPGSDLSALAHLLGEHSTMPLDRGLFLERTWRLHPEVCRFTSELFYAGRLSSRDGLDVQTVNGVEPLTGSGLRFIPVDHQGNIDESPEEVEVVARLIRRLLDAKATWIDEKGLERPIGIDDILVVAPYNAQVSAIAEVLPTGARVGTVDKFQGQEAPIVIYSMATSTAEEAPRGMGFLFSPNRLNVATSRARALVAVVANPSLFEPDCRTPEQMRLANAFCRFAELAVVR